jgi:anti-sigma regulatory factor (Ser/Thr protein kinase)
MSIASHPKYLKLVRSVILQCAMLMNFSEKISKDITLAVDEALTNVIKHSYMGCLNKRIDITIYLLDDRLELKICDFGKKVDPKTIKPRNLCDVKPGGLGVFFMKKIMDEVDYDISSPKGTTLTMIKYKEDTGEQSN